MKSLRASLIAFFYLLLFLRPGEGAPIAHFLEAALPPPGDFTALDGSPSQNDAFGTVVAKSGPFVAVSAVVFGLGVADQNGVHVYNTASATVSVPVFSFRAPAGQKDLRFGSAIAFAGSRLLIANPAFNTVYVYDLSGATPTEPTLTITNPFVFEANNSFGFQLVGSGSRVAVAATGTSGGNSYARIYVYDLDGPTPSAPQWTITGVPSSPYLRPSAMALDGSILVAGATSSLASATEGGTVFVFDLASATPTDPVLTIHNPTPASGDGFGDSVAVSGNVVVVGARYDDTRGKDTGSVYVFDIASSTPGAPVAVINHASVFTSNPGDMQELGRAVAISGNRIVIGTSNVHSFYCRVFVYELHPDYSVEPVATLVRPGIGMLDDKFGTALCINGGMIVVGAPGIDTVAKNKGYAFIYAPGNPDTDGDGLDDSWETAWFGSSAGHSASGDEDQDGRVDLLEEAFGGSPLLPDVYFTPPAWVENGYLTMRLIKYANVLYKIESASSPDDGAFSDATTTVILDEPNQLTVRDNVPKTDSAMRFMRIKIVPIQ